MARKPPAPVTAADLERLRDLCASIWADDDDLTARLKHDLRAPVPGLAEAMQHVGNAITFLAELQVAMATRLALKELAENTRNEEA